MQNGFIWITLFLSSITLAQPSPHLKKPATLIYQSVFHDYRAFKNEKLQAWQEVNDQVEKLGGHMGHYHGMRSREQLEGTSINLLRSPIAASREFDKSGSLLAYLLDMSRRSLRGSLPSGLLVTISRSALEPKQGEKK